MTILTALGQLLPFLSEDDGWHSFDFINKAFECLDLIGWEYAADMLPSVVGQMAAARGTEERTAWRQPLGLIGLCQQAALELPQLFAAGDCRARCWSGHVMLSESLLADDPVAIIGADGGGAGGLFSRRCRSRTRLCGGAPNSALWRRQRAFRLGNRPPRLYLCERRPPDAQADRQRAGSGDPVEAVRGLPHGAMALYLARYLNVPLAAQR